MTSHVPHFGEADASEPDETGLGGPPSGFDQRRGSVLLVDRDSMVSGGLAMVLTAMGCGVRTLKSDEVHQLKRELSMGDFSVVLVRIQPGPALAAGLELVRTAAEEGATVAVVSDTTQDLIFGAAISKGACALLPTTEPVADSVDRVLALLEGDGVVTPGEAERLLALVDAHRRERQGRLMPFETLSRRESEVLGYLMDGMSVNKIAETSFVSVGTVRTQVKAVLRKLGVSSQVAAVALAYKSGWPEVDASLPVDLRFRSTATAVDEPDGGS